MTRTRTMTAAAIAAASLVSLTGCIQLPQPAQTPQQPATQSPTANDNLGGTSWSGTSNAPTGETLSLVFTLEDDGTLYITQWGDETEGLPYDSPADTWSVQGDQFELHLSDIKEIGGITYKGTLAQGSMSLTGVDDNGTSGYSMTITGR